MVTAYVGGMTGRPDLLSHGLGDVLSTPDDGSLGRKCPDTDSACAVECRAHAGREVLRDSLTVDDAVHRWAPRALADTRRAPLRHSLDESGSCARSENPSLRGGKPSAIDALQLGERPAERGHVALGNRGKHCHEHEVRRTLYFVLRGNRKRCERGRLVETTHAGTG